MPQIVIVDIDPETLPFEAYRAEMTRRLGYDPFRPVSDPLAGIKRINARLIAEGHPPLAPWPKMGWSVSEGAAAAAEQNRVKDAARFEELKNNPKVQEAAKIKAEVKHAVVKGERRAQVQPQETQGARPAQTPKAPRPPQALVMHERKCRVCEVSPAQYRARQIEIHDWICTGCAAKRSKAKVKR